MDWVVVVVSAASMFIFLELKNDGKSEVDAASAVLELERLNFMASGNENKTRSFNRLKPLHIYVTIFACGGLRFGGWSVDFVSR